MKCKVILLSLIVTACLMLISGCQDTPNRNGMRDISGSDVQTSLLIIFNQSVTYQQINEFWEKSLSTPSPYGHGYALRPGIMGVFASEVISDHKSIGVDFWPDANKEQQDLIINDVKASPLVYKVIENIVPSSVKTVN